MKKYNRMAHGTTGIMSFSLNEIYVEVPQMPSAITLFSRCYDKS